MSPAAVIAWLESTEGEEWSQANHERLVYGGGGVFACIKDDQSHVLGFDESFHAEVTRKIQKDIDKYGMNGLPPER